jgi:hypothetical protein
MVLDLRAIVRLAILACCAIKELFIATRIACVRMELRVRKIGRLVINAIVRLVTPDLIVAYKLTCN